MRPSSPTSRLIPCLLIAAAIVFAGAARGEVIEIEGRGSVATGAGNPPGIALGDPVTFRYRYDTATLDTQASPTVGFYPGGDPSELVVHVDTSGGDVAFVCLLADVRIENDAAQGDAYGVNGQGCVEADLDPVDAIALLMRDASATAFASDALPTTAPALASFLTQRGLVVAIDSVSGPSFTSTVTQLQVVPEPGAGSGGAVALAALALAARRRRR